MTKWYYKNSENYKRQSANISSPNFPYMSWLEYKRKFHIVKYYPTYNMYINYRYWCFANSYTPLAVEQTILKNLTSVYLKCWPTASNGGFVRFATLLLCRVPLMWHGRTSFITRSETAQLDRNFV